MPQPCSLQQPSPWPTGIHVLGVPQCLCELSWLVLWMLRLKALPQVPQDVRGPLKQSVEGPFPQSLGNF